MKLRLLLSLRILLMWNALLRAQDRSITGTVSDETGTFPGVTVTVKGTSRSTDANTKGAYRIIVPSSANTLTFSAVGMKTVERIVGNLSIINVRLETRSEQLSEVIVTALGIKRDRDKFASSALL